MKSKKQKRTKTQSYSLKKRLYMLLLVCLVPLTVMVIYLTNQLMKFADRYAGIVENITMANEYSTDFKEDMDYIMYTIVVNGERAGELVDTERPYEMISDAIKTFFYLRTISDAEYTKNRLTDIMETLYTLEDRVEEIEADVNMPGSYDRNMERLDLNIRVLTDLLQEQIQKYIYYEMLNLKVLQEDIRMEMNNNLQTVIIAFALMLVVALALSKHIMKNITEPIDTLADVAAKAGKGDFNVRMPETGDDEMAVLYTSMNQMIEKIGNLVEDIRIEQLNLRATELKLLQSQINPHFLYNTLDAIIWLAEANKKEQVVNMVSSLSEFFRTTLSKGRDYISVQEEESHIRSYLEIQQFRYQDILQYDILIPKELYDYQVLKLMLQPLVENALYHGIKNKRGMGHILVTGEERDGELHFQVKDNGIGMTDERLKEVRKMILGDRSVEIDSKSGFGLSNVAQRIELNYGKQYGLTVESEYGLGTVVTVKLPIVKK